MIFTRAGERWRVVVGTFAGLYLARWIERETDRRTGEHWQIASPNLQTCPARSPLTASDLSGIIVREQCSRCHREVRATLSGVCFDCL